MGIVIAKIFAKYVISFLGVQIQPIIIFSVDTFYDDARIVSSIENGFYLFFYREL